MDETGSYGWRSAPIFASDHRGAPQKSAKRKRFQCVPYSLRVSEGSAEPFRSGSLAASVPAARYDARQLWIGASCGPISRAEAGAAKSAKRKRVHWVPYSFRVSEGSAEPFCSGSLAASVPAVRYDANCCKTPFPASQCVLRVNFLSIYTNRKYLCHTKSSLLLRGGDFSLPFYSSLPLCRSQHRNVERFFWKASYSLYKRTAFPWLGRGSVSGWGKVLFRPTGYGVSTGNRHTGHISRQGYSPKPGCQGAGSGVFTAVLD